MSVRLLTLILCFLTGAADLTASAQDNDILPASRYLTTFRFRVLNGGIILARVRLGTFPDSLSFIFDTGCGGASLDSATAAKYNLLPKTSQYFIRGIAGRCQQKLLEGMSVSLGTITLDSLSMQVSDMTFSAASTASRSTGSTVIAFPHATS